MKISDLLLLGVRIFILYEGLVSLAGVLWFSSALAAPLLLAGIVSALSAFIVSLWPRKYVSFKSGGAYVLLTACTLLLVTQGYILKINTHDFSSEIAIESIILIAVIFIVSMEIIWINIKKVQPNADPVAEKFASLIMLFSHYGQKLKSTLSKIFLQKI